MTSQWPCLCATSKEVTKGKRVYLHVIRLNTLKRDMTALYRSFSLSRNKKINWKPSSGRSQENEMV